MEHIQHDKTGSLNSGDNESSPRFQIKDEPVENFRRLRVIVIGAGFSGIYLGIRIPEWLRNIDLTIYEKNERVGGTWWENTYPGCACDIPAHSYVYTFEPNPDWSTFYASAKEIQGYLEAVCKKYSVGRFIKFGHQVANCKWDESAKCWHVSVQNGSTGETFEDRADVVISARGALNDLAWPDIAGLETFKGKVVHSSKWDTRFDYSNKRIGVVGGGSSAIQIVPELQKLPGVSMTCFVRSKTWIARPIGFRAMEKLGIDNVEFSQQDRDRHMADPEKYLQFRKLIEQENNSAHSLTQKGSQLSEWLRTAYSEMMTTRLAKKPELATALLPAFAVGCRRLTPGPGYLEALTEDNVDFVSAPIREINTDGAVLTAGRQIDLDVLVCATGFHAMAAPPFPVVGMHQQTLSSRFEPYPEAYLSLAVDGFPNFFLMLGPNAGVGTGSLTKVIECVGDYTIRCIRKMQKEDIRAMHVKPERVRDFSAYVDEYFKKTVYLDNCKSWYRSNGGTGDRIHGLWPGSTLHAIETLRSPRWEDFEYIAEGEEEAGTAVNRMRWLGNGWSSLQLQEGADMSYYIDPEFVDVPSTPLPEETPRYQKCAFTP